MNRRLKFGIEEEYFITDLHTRRMSDEPPGASIEACQEAMGNCFAYEMFQGQIEVASPIFTCMPEAENYLVSARTNLQRRLVPYGLGLLCAGSHPLADWRTQQATGQDHFLQLFDDYQRVARRSVLSGLHVHVEVPGHLDRIQVMNEVLPWTPLLLALSSSSPFWDGADSGFMSYRQTACDEWPRMGIPEYFEDEAAHDAYIALLMRTGAIRQASECWWGVRPASRYPTLELRMTDACPRLEDTLCIASFFRLLVAYAIDQPRPGSGYSQESRWILKENRWRAKRSGTHGAFIVEGYDRPFSAEQWLVLAQQILGETARSMHVENVFSQARRILRNGTSADRQRSVYQRALRSTGDTHAALADVVDQLLMETSQEPCASDDLQPALCES
ncbi:MULTISPECIES: carboxylate-amine ligase [Pseudomonas]|uniref:Putative glutamate--cysteine ligase 2 n=1 Tax=Pseudomonas umsongensis TaxID=198618 RepID=A0ABX4E0Q9_9PSED|nr:MULTISPECIES: carboxylate-amine ligase [Pseudomonas]EPA95067.1 carboxylate-amine ligase, YbdK family [Pseudomonas sp. G5(2012)]OXR35233.1 carboxylate-amine ligase [Pseudomonas umsongensis]SDT27242.1 carboxylate-amine ligase [Pseudomonas umsongensis]